MKWVKVDFVNKIWDYSYGNSNVNGFIRNNIIMGEVLDLENSVLIFIYFLGLERKRERE